MKYKDYNVCEDLRTDGNFHGPIQMTFSNSLDPDQDWGIAGQGLK